MFFLKPPNLRFKPRSGFWLSWGKEKQQDFAYGSETRVTALF